MERRTRLGEEDVFRSGLNAPPFRRRRPDRRPERSKCAIAPVISHCPANAKVLAVSV
jgi:hypothetical protein